MLLSHYYRAGDIVWPMDHPVLSQRHSLIHLITAPICNTQALTKLAVHSDGPGMDISCWVYVTPKLIEIFCR